MNREKALFQSIFYHISIFCPYTKIPKRMLSAYIIHGASLSEVGQDISRTIGALDTAANDIY